MAIKTENRVPIVTLIRVPVDNDQKEKHWNVIDIYELNLNPEEYCYAICDGKELLIPYQSSRDLFYLAREGYYVMKYPIGFSQN